MLKHVQRAALAWLTSLAVCAPLQAETARPAPADERQYVSFSGFGTVGALHNRGDGAQMVRDLTQPKGAANRGITWETDTRIGLQANFRPSEELEAVAQVVSHYRWNNNFQPELTWAFLKYTPNEAISLRAGRIGFDAFLAADSRDVGFSYLWARPPVEFYGVLTVPYLDGIDAIFRLPLGDGVGRMKIYSGLDRQVIPTQFGLTENLDGSRTYGGILDYQDNHWTFRIGQATTQLAREFPYGGLNFPLLLDDVGNSQNDPAIRDALNSIRRGIAVAGKHTRFTSFELAYEDGPLQIQGAVSHLKSETLLLPDSKGGFLSVGYRLGRFTPYAAVSAVKSEKNYRAEELRGRGTGLEPLLSVADYLFTSADENQRTLSLGMRYALTHQVALKLQADLIRNKTCSPISLPVVGASPACSTPLLWPSLPTRWDGRATAYSAVLDFIF